MCRTAERPRRASFAAVQLLVGCLAACLGWHFLLEDAFLMQAMPLSSAASADELNCEEAGHLDDGVMEAHPPVKFASQNIPAVPGRCARVIHQAVLPLLPPPKTV